MKSGVQRHWVKIHLSWHRAFECNEERSATKSFSFMLYFFFMFECNEERSATKGIVPLFARLSLFECNEERSATKMHQGIICSTGGLNAMKSGVQPCNMSISSAASACLNAMKSGVQLCCTLFFCCLQRRLNAMKSGVQPHHANSFSPSWTSLNAMKSGVQLLRGFFSEFKGRVSLNAMKSGVQLKLKSAVQAEPLRFECNEERSATHD